MIFENAVELIINIEGEYSNRPDDLGGETKYGISKKAYPHLDIKNLTKAQAAEIYKQDFWDLCKIEQLPDLLKFIVFDCAVNQGQGTAIKLLQAAVGVTTDGLPGKNTFDAIERLPVEIVCREFARRRLARYFKTKTFESNGQGWINRLMEVIILATVFRR